MRSHVPYMNFKEEGDLNRSILGFSTYLRLHGFQVGLDASMDAINVVHIGGITYPSIFKSAFKAIYCGSAEDQEKFDELFDAYWKLRVLSFKNKTTYHNQQRTNPIASAVMLGFSDSETEKEEDAKNTSGGNREERLRMTDFSKVSTITSDELDDLAQRLWKEMSLRMKKKQKYHQKKGVIDIRKSIRSNAGNGFELLELFHKLKKPEKHKLIMILDVSGSMDKYSFYLLRFMWCLKAHFKSIECFIFSTRILRITDWLDKKDLESTLNHLKANVAVWGSGTKIGDSIKSFNEVYAKQYMQSKNITLILSDGLETGDENILSAEIEHLKRKTAKLIWLNPLKGMNEYEPTQKGMRAVINKLDVFHAANNLNSLLELENILSYV